MKHILITLISLFQFGCASQTYYYQNNNKVILTPVSHSAKSFNNTDFYKEQNGALVGVTNKLLVKFINTSNLDKYIKEFDLKLKSILGTNLYLFQVSNKSLTINISNELTKKNDIKFAHPDFLRQRVKI